MLEANGIQLKRIAQVLGVAQSRITELRSGTRRLQYEEARTLIDTFNLPVPTRHALIRVTAMPADTNPYGGVFGGWLMGQMGLACGSFASRGTRGKAILVAADGIKFPGAMAVGDELSVYVEKLKEGRTSLRLKAQAIARERDGEREQVVAEGEFTFVALDEAGKPREIAGE